MHICKSLCARKIGPKLLFRIHFVAMPENTDEKRDRRGSKLHKHKQFFWDNPLLNLCSIEPSESASPIGFWSMRQFFAVGEFCVRTSVELDFSLDNKQKKRLSRMLPTLPTTAPSFPDHLSSSYRNWESRYSTPWEAYLSTQMASGKPRLMFSAFFGLLALPSSKIMTTAALVSIVSQKCHSVVRQL